MLPKLRSSLPTSPRPLQVARSCGCSTAARAPTACRACAHPPARPRRGRALARHGRPRMFSPRHAATARRSPHRIRRVTGARLVGETLMQMTGRRPRAEDRPGLDELAAAPRRPARPGRFHRVGVGPHGTRRAASSSPRTSPASCRARGHEGPLAGYASPASRRLPRRGRSPCSYLSSTRRAPTSPRTIYRVGLVRRGGPRALGQRLVRRAPHCRATACCSRRWAPCSACAWPAR